MSLSSLAGRRLDEMVGSAARLVAIELVVAAQAIDLRGELELGAGAADGARVRARAGRVPRFARAHAAARSRSSRARFARRRAAGMTTYDVHQHLWPEPFVAALRDATTPPPRRRRPDDVGGRFALDLAPTISSTASRVLDRDGIEVAVLSLQTSLGLESLGRPSARSSSSRGSTASGRSFASSTAGSARSPRASVRDGFAGVSVGSSAFARPRGERTGARCGRRRRRGRLRASGGGSAPAPTRPAQWWDWVDRLRRRDAGGVLRLAGLRPRALAAAARRCSRSSPAAGRSSSSASRTAASTFAPRSIPNTFFDVSTHGRRAIELCIETFGVGQLVYGSDTPVVDSRPTLDAVRGFGDAVTRRSPVRHTGARS